MWKEGGRGERKGEFTIMKVKHENGTAGGRRARLLFVPVKR